jgi:hypothetical protein
MDPTQIPTHDGSSLALVFGAIMAAIKIAEKAWEKWLASRRKPEEVVCRLDPAASRAVADTLETCKAIEAVVDRRDGDGNPLVYSGKRLADVSSEIESLRSQAESQHEAVLRALDRRG